MSASHFLLNVSSIDLISYLPPSRRIRGNKCLDTLNKITHRVEVKKDLEKGLLQCAENFKLCKNTPDEDLVHKYETRPTPTGLDTPDEGPWNLPYYI